jgi:uncharacterized protein YycO
MVSFHFYDKSKPLNKAIEKKTFGVWSHVSVTMNGMTYEAIGGRIFGVNGVLVSTGKTIYHTGRNKPENIETITIKGTDNKSALEYLRSSVGKKYSYRGIISFIFPFLSRRSKNKYCSKLAAEAFEILTGQKLAQKEISVNSMYDIVKAYEQGYIKGRS